MSRIVEEHGGFRTGQRVRIIDDASEPGLVEAGDEGIIDFELVGKPEFGNERVCASFSNDHTEGEEVDLANIEPVE